MELVAQRLHATRELSRVNLQVPCGVAVAQHPAVVDVNIGVADVAQPRGNQRVCHLKDELLAHVAAERIPAVGAASAAGARAGSACVTCLDQPMAGTRPTPLSSASAALAKSNDRSSAPYPHAIPAV